MTFFIIFLDTYDMTARVKDASGIHYANAYYIIQYGKLIHIKDLDLRGHFDPYFSNSEEAIKTIEEQKKDFSILWNYNFGLIKSFQEEEEISYFLNAFMKEKNIFKKMNSLDEENIFEDMVAFYKVYLEKSDLIGFYIEKIRDNMQIKKKIDETITWNINHHEKDNRYEKLENLRSEKKLFFDKIL